MGASVLEQRNFLSDCVTGVWRKQLYEDNHVWYCYGFSFMLIRTDDTNFYADQDPWVIPDDGLKQLIKTL